MLDCFVLLQCYIVRLHMLTLLGYRAFVTLLFYMIEAVYTTVYVNETKPTPVKVINFALYCQTSYFALYCHTSYFHNCHKLRKKRNVIYNLCHTNDWIAAKVSVNNGGTVLYASVRICIKVWFFWLNLLPFRGLLIYKCTSS